MKPHRPTKVGTARCAVRATERSVRWHNVVSDWLGRSFRRLTLRSATVTSQRYVPTMPLALAIVALAFAASTIAEETTNAAASPSIIYVADFELDAANIKIDPAAPPAPPKAPGFLGKVLPPSPGAKKDPQQLARELVDSMSETIIKDLTKAGLTARRLPTGEPLPTAGWLVRGMFTNVNQGNQLERAVVGFGKGKTELQVLMDIHDPSKGAPTQFHVVTNSVSASSGKLPGAAPMIERHPAAVAARFVMAGNDLNKNIKQTAGQIAKEVERKVRCRFDRNTHNAGN